MAMGEDEQEDLNVEIFKYKHDSTVKYLGVTLTTDERNTQYITNKIGEVQLNFCCKATKLQRK